MGGDGTRHVMEVTTAGYADMTDMPGTVVIGMGAPWCGPWRMFRRVFLLVASVMADETTTFLTCDLDENPTLAFLEGVTRIPSVIVYHDGRRVKMHVGTLSAEELATVVKTAGHALGDSKSDDDRIDGDISDGSDGRQLI